MSLYVYMLCLYLYRAISLSHIQTSVRLFKDESESNSSVWSGTTIKLSNLPEFESKIFKFIPENTNSNLSFFNVTFGD